MITFDNRPNILSANIDSEIVLFGIKIRKITDTIYPQDQGPLTNLAVAAIGAMIKSIEMQAIDVCRCLTGISDLEIMYIGCNEICTEESEYDALNKIINKLSGISLGAIHNIQSLSSPMNNVFQELSKWKENKEQILKAKEGRVEKRIEMVNYICANTVTHLVYESDRKELLLLAQTCIDSAEDEKTFPKHFERLNYLASKIKLFSKEKGSPSINDDLTMFTIMHRSGNLNFVLNNMIVLCSTKEERDQLMSMYDFCYERIAFSNDFYNRSFNNLINFKMRLEGKEEIFGIPQPIVEEKEDKEQQHVKGVSYNDVHNAQYNELEIIYQRAKKNCFTGQQKSLLEFHYNDCFNKIKFQQDGVDIALKSFNRFESIVELYAKRNNQESVEKEEVKEKNDSELPRKDWGKWGHEDGSVLHPVSEKEDLVIKPSENPIFKQPETLLHIPNFIIEERTAILQKAFDQALKECDSALEIDKIHKCFSHGVTLIHGESALFNELVNSLNSFKQDQRSGWKSPVKVHKLPQAFGYDNVEAMCKAIAKQRTNQSTKTKRKGKYYKK